MKYFLIFLLGVAATLALDTSVEEFKNANNLFASTVYKEISKKEKGNNFLVSPFSAETILAFTHSGARSQTAQELRNALHLSQNEKIESGIKALLPNLTGEDSFTLRTANKMYLKNGFVVKDGFKKAAIEVYSSDSENIDFTKKVEAAEVMNHWVEKQTENRIHDLIDPKILNNKTRMVLINALYFKADWLQPFRLANTEKMTFYKTPRQSVEAETMYSIKDQFYLYHECHHLNAKFLELPFQGEEASMTIILPNRKRGLATLETQLDLALIPQNVTSQRVYVALPKFKIETKIDLKRILRKLGVRLLFKDFEADLSGIAGDPGDLVVNEVIQKTFIDVSEEGVEAAAATLSIVSVPRMGWLSQPKEFIADHPFIFYVRVKGVIIFVGRLTEPKV